MEGYGRRALVADPCEETRVSVSELLAGAEYNVHIARDVVEVFRQLAPRRYDVIVVGDHRPGMDCLDVIALGQMLCPNTPIVVLGYVNADPIPRVLRHGAHAWVDKPHDAREVLMAVHAAAAREEVHTV